MLVWSMVYFLQIYLLGKIITEIVQTECWHSEKPSLVAYVNIVHIIHNFKVQNQSQFKILK